MQGVWWSHCFNAGGFRCYEIEKIVRRLASADVGNGVTVTDLINLSPSTMQIVGAFEILSVVVGWSSSNVRFWSLKFKPANLWAWQNLGFAKTSVAHSLAKKLCRPLELTATFDHHPRNFSIVCDSPKSAWNSQQCKTIDSSSKCSANTSRPGLSPKLTARRSTSTSSARVYSWLRRTSTSPSMAISTPKISMYVCQFSYAGVWLDGSGD